MTGESTIHSENDVHTKEHDIQILSDMFSQMCTVSSVDTNNCIKLPDAQIQHTGTGEEPDVVVLVAQLTSNYTRIVHRDELRQYKKLDWGDNGIGDRWCGKKFNYSVIFNNRYKTYSENDDDTVPAEILNSFQTSNGSGKGIIGIFVHSKRTNIIKRPIKKEIDREIKKMPCVCCGSKSDLICDHKNDIYNDDIVLDVKTQRIDDFQSLCNHCNLQKRQIFKEETANRKIYSAKNLAPYRTYPFEFPWEKKNFDVKDIHTKKDTFWYDPVEFNKKIFLYITCTIPIISEIHRKIKKNTLTVFH